MEPIELEILYDEECRDCGGRGTMPLWRIPGKVYHGYLPAVRVCPTCLGEKRIFVRQLAPGQDWRLLVSA